jgi:hypothetical protein
MRAGAALPAGTASWMNVVIDRDEARGDRASECPPADPLVRRRRQILPD